MLVLVLVVPASVPVPATATALPARSVREVTRRPRTAAPPSVPAAAADEDDDGRGMRMDADPYRPSGCDWAHVGDVVPLAFAGVTAILLLPLPRAPRVLLPLLQPGSVLGVAAL